VALHKFKLNQLTSASSLSVLAVVVLLFGLVIAVVGSQQTQENRSHASSPGDLIAHGTVNANSATGPTISNLIPGAIYSVVVSGYVNYRNASGYSPILVDAQWGDPGTTAVNTSSGCFCTRYSEPKFNGVGLVATDVGTTGRADHTYHYIWQASGTTLQFSVADSKYTDNTGAFTYDMYLQTLPSNTPTTTPTLTDTPTPTAKPTVTPTRTPSPTFTPAPTLPPTTSFGLEMLLHGIGKGGDSANPGGEGNYNIIHLQRPVTVQVFDVQNNLVETKQGLVVFDTTAGSFKGTIDMGPDLQSGVYTVKVKLPQSLNTLIPGIQTITNGILNQLPLTTLISGDVNNDNAVNVIDYDILLNCYSDFLPAISCTSTQKTEADLTDDGHVNQFDYNLFLRELTNIGGQ